MSDHIHVGGTRVDSLKCAYCLGVILDDVSFRKNAGLFYHAACREENKADEQTKVVKPSLKEGSSSLVLPSYANLEFEERAVRAGYGKKLFNFEGSVADVPRRKFERHALPYEAFGVICDGLEGKLQGTPLQVVYDDMMSSYGEWLGVVVKAQGGVLYCFEHPKDILGSGAVSVREFSLNGLQLGCYTEVREVTKRNPLIVEYFWSRPYEELPSHIQDRAYLHFLGEGVAWPVARGDFGRYGVGGCDCDYGASRGVRQKNSTPDGSLAVPEKKGFLKRLFGG